MKKPLKMKSLQDLVSTKVNVYNYNPLIKNSQGILNNLFKRIKWSKVPKMRKWAHFQYSLTSDHHYKISIL